VYAVGSKTGTFGVPGVREHCYFLKEIGDAQRLRRALLRRFDEASYPGTLTCQSSVQPTVRLLMHALLSCAEMVCAGSSHNPSGRSINGQLLAALTTIQPVHVNTTLL
jgi:hypothetical protein